MKRLRHPVRAIREPFGKAGLTVAILALVLAMVGGAWAAAGLTGKQKKQVIKIAKKYAGKPGAAGPAGTAGTNGTNGKDGTNGSPGAAGKSVAVTKIEEGEAECEERGGAEVKQEGAGSGTEVCNGAEGSPWTELGTLPSKKTETGSWFFAGKEVPVFGGFVKVAYAPISFPIPLPVELPASQVVVVAAGANGAGGTSGCPATSEVKNPEAQPGFLCIFRSPVEENLASIEAQNPGTGEGTGTSGAFLALSPVTSGETILASGTWAVTAP